MPAKKRSIEVLKEGTDYNLRNNEASLYRGKFMDAEFYFNSKGQSPAKNAFEQLNEIELAKFAFNIRKLCDEPLGTKHPKSVSNIEDTKEKIFAVKYSGQGRMSSFTCTIIEKGKKKFEKPKIIITGRYIKKNQKNSKKEDEAIQKAIERKNDYKERIKIDEKKTGKKNYYELEN